MGKEKMKLYKTSLETRNYSFEVYSTNRLESKKMMEAGIRKHCEQFDISHVQFLNDYKASDWITEAIILNTPYRDGQEI